MWPMIWRYIGVTLRAFAVPVFAAEGFSFSSPHFPASSLGELTSAIMKGTHQEEIPITGTLRFPQRQQALYRR